MMNVLHFLQKPEDKGRKITPVKKRRSSSKSSAKKAKRSRVEKKGISISPKYDINIVNCVTSDFL